LWCNVIDSTCNFLWSLSVKEKKSNGILFIVKNVVQKWWASKTRVHPNKSNVTWQTLELGVFDKKLTHFLMETQVCVHMLMHFYFNFQVTIGIRCVVCFYTCFQTFDIYIFLIHELMAYLIHQCSVVILSNLSSNVSIKIL
jgi:hypothetical protein